jgi:uncharacterized protein (TIGR03435 family)
VKNQPGEAIGFRKQKAFRTGILLAAAASLGVTVVATECLDVQPSSSQIVRLAFDAASVKMNKSGSEQGLDKVSPGGRFTATNLTLEYLIRFAYERSPQSRGMEPFEVTNGPGWIRRDRFDVNATAGREVSLKELRSMLQAMLVERFKLRTHYETRQAPVYRMMVANRDKLGPQLRRAEAECASVPADPLRGITPGKSEPCGYFGPSPTVPMGSDRAYQAIRGLSMADFAMRLYPYLGRRVVDGTGLAGYFDAEFEFTAEVVMPPPSPEQPNPYDGRVLPSIFSVLPQQLGLRLESQRGAVEVLVVDYAEHPTDN